MDARLGTGLGAIVILAVIIGLLAARTQARTVAAPTPTPMATDVPVPDPGTVNMVHLPNSSQRAFFNPPQLTVTVRQVVTFYNTDDIAHNAIADNGAFNLGILSAGQKKEWVPTKPGRYAYGCFLHPDMRGVIIVKSFTA